MLPIRTTEGIGVSISTALALSRFFKDRIKDDERDLMFININDYPNIIFNSHTLIRNIVNAYDGDVRKDILTNNIDSDIIDVLLDELHVITTALENFKTQPVLFLPDYTPIKQHILKDYVKTTKLTQNDLHFELSHRITQKISNMSLPIPTISKGFKLPYNRDRFLLLTHMTLDLLNIKHNPQMELLESHTGRIKTKDQFNTKYRKINKIDLDHLPFDEIIIYIMGDNTFIRPMPLTIRRETLTTSIKYNWTKFTTHRKVMINLRKNKKISDAIKNLKTFY